MWQVYLGGEWADAAGAAAHGGRESEGDADLWLQEEDRRGRDQVQAAAEFVWGGAQRPQLVQQEFDREAGRDQWESTQAEDYDASDWSAQGGDSEQGAGSC